MLAASFWVSLYCDSKVVGKLMTKVFQFTGFSGGTYSLVSSIYISECSESDIRGTFGNLMPMMICLGVLFVNGLGSLMHWMVLTSICIIFPALILVLMPFMPESPVYLLSKQREADAMKSLERLRGTEYDTWGEIQQIQKSLAEQEAVGSVSVKELLLKREYLMPTIVSLMLMIIQQLSGISGIMSYLADIFLRAGTGMSPGLQATLVSLCQVIFQNLLIIANEETISVCWDPRVYVFSGQVWSEGAATHFYFCQCSLSLHFGNIFLFR